VVWVGRGRRGRASGGGRERGGGGSAGQRWQRRQRRPGGRGQRARESVLFSPLAARCGRRSGREKDANWIDPAAWRTLEHRKGAGLAAGVGGRRGRRTSCSRRGRDCLSPPSRAFPRPPKPPSQRTPPPPRSARIKPIASVWDAAEARACARSARGDEGARRSRRSLVCPALLLARRSSSSTPSTSPLASASPRKRGRRADQDLSHSSPSGAGERERPGEERRGGRVKERSSSSNRGSVSFFPSRPVDPGRALEG
jgi:hypothetical protein